MNVQEMHIGVNLGVQKVNSNAFDNLLEEEIDYYLNKGIREFIRRQNLYLRDKLEGISRQDLITGNEAIENLGDLITETTVGSTNISDVTNYNNARSVQKPTDMFSFVYGHAQPTSGSEWRSCKLISTSDVHLYARTEYNDPIFRRYPVLIVGSDIYIFYDSEGGGVNDFSMMYIKEPAKVDLSGDVDSNLPSHTHDDIVNLAVGMITEDIKSARPYEQNQTTIKGED